MNIHDLRQAQKIFDKRKFKEEQRHLNKLRVQFVKDFSLKNLESLSIDDFVVGRGQYTFCYRLERELDRLGRILGSPAKRYGVFYFKETREYKHTKIWGKNYSEAFENIRRAIIDLIKAGEKNNIEALVSSKISPMFKGKILSTYFPERYLNIFSDEHLNHYLTFFGRDFDINNDAVYKRDALILFKNEDSVMRTWDNQTFAKFLYSEYPKAPVRNEDSIPELKGYESIIFPCAPEIEEIKLTIINKIGFAEKSRASKASKKNYERENKRMKELGDRGEDIVKAFEKDRLTKEGNPKLAKKVERVSLKSDSYGYDILSFNQDGTERHIEVKATQSKAGTTDFFLTINELNTAKEDGETYFVYIVYEILTDKPKVWALKNPFINNQHGIKIEPVNYRVKVFTEKI